MLSDQITIFFDELTRSSTGILMLDYDGTLAPFQIDRHKAFPYPGVENLLDNIMATGATRVIIVSGRSIQDLRPLLRLSHQPELWGSHGWERLMPNGSYSLLNLETRQAEGLELALEKVYEAQLIDHCERKPVSLAIHWRGLTQERANAIKEQVLGEWLSLTDSYNLEIHSFDGGVELRVPGRDKGYAVRTILVEADRRQPVAYLGDDRTDEDAFNALNGSGISILVRNEYRDTAAQIWIKPPDDLIAFLSKWYMCIYRDS